MSKIYIQWKRSDSNGVYHYLGYIGNQRKRTDFIVTQSAGKIRAYGAAMPNLAEQAMTYESIADAMTYCEGALKFFSEDVYGRMPLDQHANS